MSIKYRIIRRTPYYRTGPQQGLPEDGYFDKNDIVNDAPPNGGGADGWIYVTGHNREEGWINEADATKL